MTSLSIAHEAGEDNAIGNTTPSRQCDELFGLTLPAGDEAANGARANPARSLDHDVHALLAVETSDVTETDVSRRLFQLKDQPPAVRRRCESSATGARRPRRTGLSS